MSADLPARTVAVLQMTGSIEPERNKRTIIDAMAEAARGGAAMIFTPEMSGMLDRDRARAAGRICREADDPVLAAVREAACRHGIWAAIGSLAILREDGRWANRSFVIDDEGEIRARYDKLHMFDVALGDGDDWRESSAYAPGDAVVAVDCPIGRLGLAICYDVRFPALFDALGRRGCDVIAIPSAFTVPTGRAHWHTLVRARAIESSAFVIAAAQAGKHDDGRETFGHSLAIDPWGDCLLDLGGDMAKLGFARIDPARIADVRTRLPSLANRRAVPT